MIHLTWSWPLAFAIAFSGAALGFVFGQKRGEGSQSWRYVIAINLVVWVAFFGPLAVFRILSGISAELQATVLYPIFLLSAYAALWIRTR